MPETKHYTAKQQVDLLTLGLLQEKRKVTELLQACQRHKQTVIKEKGNIAWDANWSYMEAAIAKATS